MCKFLSSLERCPSRSASKGRRPASPRHPSSSPKCHAAQGQMPTKCSPCVQRPTVSSSSPQQQHNSSLLVSPPLGDVNNRPKVEVFITRGAWTSRASGVDLPLVLVVLVGGNQPAATPEEFLAHLSSKFHVFEGTTRVCAWLGDPSECEHQHDGHSSSSCKRAGLEDGADLMLLSRPRQLATADTMLDPMLVEVAIQGPPLDHRSASEPGHVSVTTMDMADNHPGDVQPTFDNEDSVAEPPNLMPPRSTCLPIRH